MKRLLAVAAFLSAVVLTAPAAQAEPVYCDGGSPNALVEFLAVDQAAACGGGTGLIWKGAHEDHQDCIYYSDWPFPRSWLEHGC